MEMAEGTSMEAHIKTIKELTTRLAAINAPISEEDQVVTLLGAYLLVILPLSQLSMPEVL